MPENPVSADTSASAPAWAAAASTASNEPKPGEGRIETRRLTGATARNPVKQRDSVPA
jgi:hypothetical protein